VTARRFRDLAAAPADLELVEMIQVQNTPRQLQIPDDILSREKILSNPSLLSTAPAVPSTARPTH